MRPTQKILGSLLAGWTLTALGSILALSALHPITPTVPTILTVLLTFLVGCIGFVIAVRGTHRAVWAEWTTALYRRLHDGNDPDGTLPLAGEIEPLVQLLMAKREAGTEGTWSADRLKETLDTHLHGEQVVVLANREPYIHERGKDGQIKVQKPAGGLVTALEPVMRACGGSWVAYGSGSADREHSDESGRLQVPPGEEAYWLKRLWLSREEAQGYYFGFSNEALWPLCHIADTRPIFRSQDWEHYQAVNRRFAAAVCDEARSPEPVVLVQDYHFALAPKMIRERLPKATILAFWHIPWPNADRFGLCPWREELLQGLLGADILGFHTPLHCNNFISSIDRFLEARIDREQNAVSLQKRQTLIRAYPIGIEWPNPLIAELPSPSACRQQIIAEQGLPPDTFIGVGVDRLDYTKGLEERLLAVERLLERFPAFQGRFTFIQLSAPSRTEIDRYRQLDDSVNRAAERINQRFGRDGYRPIILFKAHHQARTISTYFRAADLCYVSSLDDGMNLVAKEFVSARDDAQGVLLLSQFTGASRELTEALVVNPYDLDQVSDALSKALGMSKAEQRERMAAMRKVVEDFNVYRWAGTMLLDVSRLRQSARLKRRLLPRESIG